MNILASPSKAGTFPFESAQGDSVAATAKAQRATYIVVDSFEMMAFQNEVEKNRHPLPQTRSRGCSANDHLNRKSRLRLWPANSSEDMISSKILFSHHSRLDCIRDSIASLHRHGVSPSRRCNIDRFPLLPFPYQWLHVACCLCARTSERETLGCFGTNSGFDSLYSTFASRR